MGWSALFRRVVLLLAASVTLVACSDEKHGPSGPVGVDGGAAGQEGLGGLAKGGDGAAGDDSGDGGAAGAPACVAGDGVPDEQPAYVGFGAALANEGPFDADGTVESVVADTLTVATGADSIDFVWQGAPLSELFAVGDSVHLVARSPQISALGYQLLSAVSSEAVTVSTLDANAWTVLPTGAGAQVLLAVEGLPKLTYGLRSCCAQGSALFCDYSELTVALEEGDVSVPRGEAVTVGDWSVGNWSSSYAQNGERVWSLRATFVEAH
jgi:hypothetical protein